MDRDGVKLHKLAKKEQGRYPAILTEWIILWLLGKIFLSDKAGSPEQARYMGY